MTNQTAQIGEQIAAILNGFDAGLDAPVTAKFSYRPVFDSKTAGSDIAATVVPVSQDFAMHTRKDTRRAFAFTVGIQRNYEDDAGLAETIAAAELMAAHLLRMRFDHPACVCRSVELAPMFDPEALAKHRVVTSILTVHVEAMQ